MNLVAVVLAVIGITAFHPSWPRDDSSMTQTPAPAPRTIEKGDISRIDQPSQVLVRTPEEWSVLWRRHAPERAMPAVDFSREMVVGVFMGSRPNAGFSTTILTTMEVKGVLVVRYKETVPPPGALTAQIITAPYHLIAIPKATVTEFKFVKVE